MFAAVALSPVALAIGVVSGLRLSLKIIIEEFARYAVFRYAAISTMVTPTVVVALAEVAFDISIVAVSFDIGIA